MTEDHDNPEDEELNLPPGLRQGLSAICGKAAPVPGEIDAAILQRAKGRYRRQIARRRQIRWVAVAASLAAIILIAVMVLQFHEKPSKTTALAGDINGDGRVDMLDAYLIARAVSSGQQLNPAWDVNHDGVVDQKDADWIAAAAVSVNGNSQGAFPQ